MKKLSLLLIIGLFIVFGCTTEDSIHFSRYTEEIKDIKYNELTLDTEDYQSINNILENIDFDNKQLTELKRPFYTIDITTIENETHRFYIYSNNTIKYIVGNNKYYAQNNNTAIINLYNEFKTKYSAL